MEGPSGTGRPARSTPEGPVQPASPLNLFVLLPLLAGLGVLVASVSAGVKTGSIPAIVTALVIGLVLAPIVFLVGFYALLAFVALLMLMFAPDLALTGRIVWVRTGLRAAALVAAIAWLACTAPAVWQAQTLQQRKDALVVAGVIPAGLLAALSAERLARFGTWWDNEMVHRRRTKNP